MKIKCPQCRGERTQTIEEDGRRIQDDCFHCQAEGFISEEKYLADRMLAMANLLACDVVERHKRLENSREDGEGWAFHAAESGMPEADYTFAAVADEQQRTLVLFQKLDQGCHELVMSLVDRLAPEDESLFVRDKPEDKTLPLKEEPEESEEYDDIPF